MQKTLLNFNWNNCEEYSTEDISYFLFIEGKGIDCIAKIRGINRDEVQAHIISGKIKYGVFAKSKDEKELFYTLRNLGKQDKLEAIKDIKEDIKIKLLTFIKNNYADMPPKEKEFAVWLVGELKAYTHKDILLKASVNNNINVRRMAISAMGKIGGEGIEPALIKALEDSNPQVVLYSIKSLTKIKSEKAKLKMEKIKENSNKEYLKIAAEKYLESLEVHS